MGAGSSSVGAPSFPERTSVWVTESCAWCRASFARMPSIPPHPGEGRAHASTEDAHTQTQMMSSARRRAAKSTDIPARLWLDVDCRLLAVSQRPQRQSTVNQPVNGITSRAIHSVIVGSRIGGLSTGIALRQTGWVGRRYARSLVSLLQRERPIGHALSTRGVVTRRRGSARKAPYSGPSASRCRSVWSAGAFHAAVSESISGSRISW